MQQQAQHAASQERGNNTRARRKHARQTGGLRTLARKAQLQP